MSTARLLGRASWNLIDQVLSAGTNAALAFVVARQVSAAGFGAFAVAFGVFMIAIGVERALVGQPMSIRHSATTGPALDRITERALGTVLALTLAIAIACVPAGLLMGGTLGTTLLVLAAFLPGLVLQDACRLIFFARSQARLAAVNDAVWAVLQFTAIATLVAVDRATPATLTAAWGASAAACTILGFRQLGVLPRPSAALGWLRQTWGLGGYLLAEYALGSGAFQTSVLAIGAVIGVDDVGSFRAAQVLIGPLGILATAAFTFALPEVSRRSYLPAARRARIGYAVGSAMAGVSLAYTAVILLVPDQVGTWLLGDTWGGARAVVLPVALGSAAAGACLGPAVVLYAAGLARSTFRLHVIGAPLLVACMVAGAAIAGTVGAAWGLAAEQILMVVPWFRQMRVSLRRLAEGPAGGQPMSAQSEPASAAGEQDGVDARA